METEKKDVKRTSTTPFIRIPEMEQNNRIKALEEENKSRKEEICCNIILAL